MHICLVCSGNHICVDSVRVKLYEIKAHMSGLSFYSGHNVKIIIIFFDSVLSE